jgi:hypothetical protein
MTSIVLVAISATAPLGSINSAWASWRPATCMPDACFCEAIRSGIVAQPANTWSNLGFVLVGLLIIVQAQAGSSSGERSSLIARHTTYAAVYGTACVVTGLGSFFYHASLTFVGQFFDVMGMYLFATFVLLYAVTRVSRLSERAFVAGYIGLNAILAYVLLAAPNLRRWVFAALLTTGLAFESRARRTSASIDRRFLQAALVALAAAFLIWILDLTKVLCAPQSWLQGHAVWHLLCAAATGLGYLYYRSERSTAASSENASAMASTAAVR